MKWRIEFIRKSTATKPGQAGMKYAVEVTAKNETEAREIATRQAASVRKSGLYDISIVRKL